MSKYNKVWVFVKDQNKENLVMSFEEIKNILNFKIDHSFLNYKKELEEYGYKVEKIFLKEKKISFVKIEREDN